MTYALSFIVIGLNFIFACSKKHKRWFVYFTLAFMWILFWANTSNPDYNSYLNLYSSANESAFFTNNLSIGAGYLLLQKVSVMLGLEYKYFLMIIVFFAFFLIDSTVRRFTNNSNYVYLLYFIFPFFLDIVQVRNFMVMALLVFSFKYLIEDKKWSNLKFFIFMILAATIQYIALFYIPFILVKKHRGNLMILFVALFVLCVSTFFIVSNEVTFLNTALANIFNNDRLADWFQVKSNFGFLLFWFMQMFSFFMVIYVRSEFNNNTINLRKPFAQTILQPDEVEIQDRFMTFLYWINILAFMYLPFYILDSTFTRLMRNMIFLNYIAFAIGNRVIRNAKSKLRFNLVVVSYLVVFSAVSLYIPYSDTIIVNVLNNNFLLA